MTAPRPLPRTDYPKDRAAIAAGYRHLADLIEADACPIPMNISIGLSIRGGEYGTTGGRPEDEYTRDLIRALGGGHWQKDTDGSPGYMVMRGMVSGLPVDLWIDRGAVCRRVVIGTETVEVPASPGIVIGATKAHTEVREIVEWRCKPLFTSSVETPDAVEVSA